MARIPPFKEADRPDLADAVARIRRGRSGALLNVYRLLLHSPPLAQTWFDHNGAVRFQTTLEGRLREIVIIRIAHLNAIPYVLRQHVPALAAAEGVTEAECAALGERTTDWLGSGGPFDARERAALAMADAMTLGTHVPDHVFAAVREHYDDRGIVELAVLVGTYLMHNRVMNALGIDLEPDENRGR